MKLEPCGYCNGTGHVPARQYDRDGRHRPEWPERRTCEYCGGSGECEDGNKLLPARKPAID